MGAFAVASVPMGLEAVVVTSWRKDLLAKKGSKARTVAHILESEMCGCHIMYLQKNKWPTTQIANLKDEIFQNAGNPWEILLSPGHCVVRGRLGC